MPKVNEDHDLLEAIEAVVQMSGHNESQAARNLGVTRLKINRIRKQQGRATPATRNDLWRRVAKFTGDESLARNSTKDTKETQIVRDVPHVALQVLRYMTAAIERHLDSESRTDA